MDDMEFIESLEMKINLRYLVPENGMIQEV